MLRLFLNDCPMGRYGTECKKRRGYVKRLSEYLFLGASGGSVYYMFEMMFRGFSHWSMFLLGGICLIFFAQQGIWTHWKAPLWKQVLWCSAFVTAGEFITGIVVNKIMGWNVWDYTDQPFQLMGQICLPFAVIFSGLCAGGILLSGTILHYLYGEEKPEFHVL